MSSDFPLYEMEFCSSRDFVIGHRLQLNKLLIVAEIEIKAFWSNKRSMVGQLLEPIIYLVFFMAGLRGGNQYVNFLNHKIDYMQFSIPGILSLLTIKMLAHTIYRSTIDKRWGLLALKFMNGVSPLTYVLGLAVYPFIIFLLQSVVINCISLFYGLQLDVVKVSFTILVGLCGMIFWISLGVIITTRINNYQQRDMIVGLIMLPLLFTAPTFYSLSLAPVYIKIISFLNPVTYQVRAMRSIYLGYPQVSMILVTIFSSALVLLMSTFLVRNAQLLSSEH